MKILVTGSSGLIGSEAVAHFDERGHEVVGVDNNMRRVFFGDAGDTLWNLARLKGATKRFTHVALDIRERVERDICNLMLDAVLLESQSSPCKENVGLASSREIGDAVADEHDERDGAVFSLQVSFGSRLLHAQSFVVT